MNPEILKQISMDAAYELGVAVGVMKFASDNPAYAQGLVNLLSPAHKDLLRAFQEAGARMAQGRAA
jgi:hypothetical protein